MNEKVSVTKDVEAVDHEGVSFLQELGVFKHVRKLHA